MKSRKGSLRVFPVYVYFTIVLCPFEQQNDVYWYEAKDEILTKEKNFRLD